MTGDPSVQAAVFHRPNDIRTQLFRRPQINADQVLVRVTCCTICGSDLHTTLGNRPAPTPSILGHEIIGLVEEVGALAPADGLQVGDRITWSVAASCGPTRVVQSESCEPGLEPWSQCPRCASGFPQKCDSLFKYGHEQVSDDVARTLSGGLAEYCVLQSGSAIVQLPDHLPDEIACPANCATATVMAAVRTTGTLRGKRVLITGAGMLGLTTAAVARVLDASSVTVCDPSSDRRKLAEHFGATTTADTVPNRKFDCVFEMSGNRQAVAAAIECTDIGGKVVLVGSVSPTTPIDFDPEKIVRGLIGIHGVHNYQPGDLLAAVQFLDQHHDRFPFASLVSRTFSLTDVPAAFDFASRNRPIRVAVRSNATN